MLVVLAAGLLMCACGNSGGAGDKFPPEQQAATPTISTAPAQNGAVVVTLADTTSGTTIYYTLDGSTPTNASQIYEAPFLVASSLTVKALAGAPLGTLDSQVASQTFNLSIPSGTLVWSDEFSNSGSTNAQPSATTWTYDLGTNCCGNNEWEDYCAWNSSVSPCDPSNPNAFVGTDGYLHIVARQTSPALAAGNFTSGRLKSQGRFSFMYGRVEARMMLPESQGMWPAFWMLGNSIATVNWPGCGELDIMEHIDGSNPPPYVGGTAPGYDWIAGSVHGGTSGATELNGTQQYHPASFSAAAWHTYGMIWTKGQIEFYVDSPSNVYATYKSTDSTWTGNTWPFDNGPQFILLNLAVGGDWPGNPDATTTFPADMQVDYVRIYSN